MIQSSVHIKELEAEDSAVPQQGNHRNRLKDTSVRGHRYLTTPDNTEGVSLSVVYPHKAHQGQQLFVWVNPNYSLDHHEKASALTSNTKSLEYKGFHFSLCFRCQHSESSVRPRRKRWRDNGI